MNHCQSITNINFNGLELHLTFPKLELQKTLHVFHLKTSVSILTDVDFCLDIIQSVSFIVCEKGADYYFIFQLIVFNQTLKTSNNGLNGLNYTSNRIALNNITVNKQRKILSRKAKISLRWGRPQIIVYLF